MSQTIETISDEDGAVRLLKRIHLTGTRGALVTILDAQPMRDESEAGYRATAQDEARETEALEFFEATIGDAGDESR
jgi:hypothetical protein